MEDTKVENEHTALGDRKDRREYDRACELVQEFMDTPMGLLTVREYHQIVRHIEHSCAQWTTRTLQQAEALRERIRRPRTAQLRPGEQR